MNYKRIYDSIIFNAQSRQIVPHVIERHHILPKSLGGSNDKSNIVSLTPKEHFVAHHLLCKIYHTKEMHYAFWLMVNRSSPDGRRNYRVNSRTYDAAKAEHCKNVSITHKGKVRSEESKRKSGNSLRGRVPWNKGLKDIYDESTRQRLSESRLGKKDSDETRKKKSESKKGVPRGPSPLRGKPKVIDQKYIRICPQCNKSGTEWNMRRYHFDNCKNKGK